MAAQHMQQQQQPLAGACPLARRLTVFDIETDRLLERGRDNMDELQMTVCVALSGADGRRHDFVMGRGPEADAATLERLGEVLDAAPLLVAYNGRGFDLRVMAQYYDASRVGAWRARLVDPFELIRDATGSWVKLDELLALNGHSPKTASGVQAVEWWRAGEWERVLEYCAADVRALWDLVGGAGLAASGPGVVRFPVKRWDPRTRAQRVVATRALDWRRAVQDACDARDV